MTTLFSSEPTFNANCRLVNGGLLVALANVSASSFLLIPERVHNHLHLMLWCSANCFSILWRRSSICESTLTTYGVLRTVRLSESISINSLLYKQFRMLSVCVLIAIISAWKMAEKPSRLIDSSAGSNVKTSGILSGWEIFTSTTFYLKDSFPWPLSTSRA